MAGMFKEGKIRTRGMGEEFRSSRNTHPTAQDRVCVQVQQDLWGIFIQM